MNGFISIRVEKPFKYIGNQYDIYCANAALLIILFTKGKTDFMFSIMKLLKIHKSIVLIGMMGAGKTHIGRMLAQKLGIEFYDTDKVIEAKAGISVAEIFEQYGEEKFRQCEKNTIKELLENEPCVIATGGGAITNPDTFALIKDHSYSIWLEVPLDLIWQRIKSSSHRPLLQDENPRKKLETIYTQREALYKQAQFHVLNEHAEQSVSSIINSIKSLSDDEREDNL